MMLLEYVNDMTHEKIAERNLHEWYKKIQLSLEEYWYLEWTEGRGDNGK